MFDDLTILEVKSHISELSKALRSFHGLSRDELAQQIDMSRITVQNLEGSKNVTIDTFLKLLQHFELLEKFDAFIVENTEDKRVSPLY